MPLMAAQTCGSGSHAAQVAMGSIDRIRLNRAPQMKFEDLLGSNLQGMDRASESFWRIANESENGLVRAVAQDREYIC